MREGRERATDKLVSFCRITLLEILTWFRLMSSNLSVKKTVSAFVRVRGTCSRTAFENFKEFQCAIADILDVVACVMVRSAFIDREHTMVAYPAPQGRNLSRRQRRCGKRLLGSTHRCHLAGNQKYVRLHLPQILSCVHCLRWERIEILNSLIWKHRKGHIHEETPLVFSWVPL